MSRGCYSPLVTGSQRTTIRDVAAAAGVSVTTVSDALSGKGRLPEETRQKVREAADRLSYRPSAIALGLREKGLGLVGLFIAPAGEAAITDVGYWATIVTHVSQTVLSEGLAPVLLPHNVDMLANLKILLDGAIVIDPLEDDPVLNFLEGKRIRYITIGRDLRRDSQSWLDDDYATGLSQLLENAVAPRTPFAFVTLGPIKSYIVDALDGARRWASETSSPFQIYHCDTMESATINAVIGLALQNGAETIIAQHDRFALRVLEALESRKLRVPADIQLLSATDSPELDRIATPISAVRQHPALLAEITARALVDLVRGRSEITKTLLPPEIVIRP